MKTIFDKTQIKNLSLKNRLFRSATWEALADNCGHFDEEIYYIYEELAKGGIGCIISGFTSVSDNDHYFGGMARLSNDSLIAEHKRLTDTVHKYDCPVIAQLVKSTMLKASRQSLDNTLEIIRTAGEIRNYERYFISTLFNETNGMHFKAHTQSANYDYEIRCMNRRLENDDYSFYGYDD